MMAEKNKISGRCCLVRGCFNSYRAAKTQTFFRLPKKADRRREWLILCGREDILEKDLVASTSYSVCAEHFTLSDMKIIKHIQPNALPSRFLPNPNVKYNADNTTIPGSESCQLLNVHGESYHSICAEKATTHYNINMDSSTFQTKRVLIAKNMEELSKNAIIASKSKEKEITKDIVEIDQKIYDLIYRMKKFNDTDDSKKHSNEYKLLTLDLYYSNTYAYRCLKTVLNLPKIKDLKKYKIKISPNINEIVLRTLSLKLCSLPGIAKYCTICIDKLNLKRNLYYNITNDEIIGFHNINNKKTSVIANNAYVIMLQGLYYDWQLPLVYTFVSNTEDCNELDSLINKLIWNLQGSDIIVKAIISNQSPVFDMYAKNKNKITIDTPFFFVENTKIYYIFNVSNLFKTVRNHLLVNNFIYEGNTVISWDHINDLYEDQKEKQLKLIPKLSDAHLAPNKTQKTAIKYATQVFSNSVHGALETYIEFGSLAEEAKGTSRFVKLMNDTFDILNSGNGKTINQITMTDYQKTVLIDVSNMLANLKYINRFTGKTDLNPIRTLYNFQITIQAVQQLFEDMKQYGFQYLHTNRLSSTNLQIYLKKIKEKCGILPTAQQFTTGYSRLFISNMLKATPPTNDNIDIHTLLEKTAHVLNVYDMKPVKEDLISPVYLSGDTEYRLQLPITNQLTYVASFLFYKCHQIHSCKTLATVVNKLFLLDKVHGDLDACNVGASFYGNLKLLPTDINEYVNQLEIELIKNIDICVKAKPGGALLEILNKIQPKTLCACFPIVHFLKIFIRFRIYKMVQFSNRLLKYSNKSVKQFFKIKQLAL